VPSKKTRFVRWRDRCAKYILDNGETYTETLRLEAGSHGKKPSNNHSASQILMRDDRFIGEYEEQSQVNLIGKWAAKQKIWRLADEE
tara:strand:+ start:4467 stop:4727 length:261 start_codon:yes stop_codon:yes gene_type:complete